MGATASNTGVHRVAHQPTGPQLSGRSGVKTRISWLFFAAQMPHALGVEAKCAALRAQVGVLDLVRFILARKPAIATVWQLLELPIELLDVMHQLMQENRSRGCVVSQIQRLVQNNAILTRVETAHLARAAAHHRLHL